MVIAREAVQAVRDLVGVQALPSFIIEILADHAPESLTELETAINERSRQ
jgi:hypothetical protein